MQVICNNENNPKELMEKREIVFDIIPETKFEEETLMTIEKINETNKRISKSNYYLNIAQEVAKRGTCLRRLYGAVIVKNDEIIATGYVGAPRGRQNCCDIGTCRRVQLNIPRGERYEMCRSVHAEANAIISAGRSKTIDSTLYLVGLEKEDHKLVKDADCCSMCKRMIINAGIKEVIIRTSETEFKTILVNQWILNDDSLGEHEGY